MDRETILKKLRELRSKDPDFSSGRIVSSVYTEPLDVAVEAFMVYADTNVLDTYLFPTLSDLESEAVAFLGRLFDNPYAAGYISTGGTESNLMALYAAKKKYPGRRVVVAPRSVHYSIPKAADLMGLEMRYIAVEADGRADIYSIEKNVSEDTLAVVATAGTSSIGAVDPLEAINEICANTYFHVDAAFGGFVLPFLDRKIGFSLENLDSLSVDPHKMGRVPIPAGAILFRDKSYMEGMAIEPSYLPVSTATLSGSRSGGSVAAVWAAINLLGREGYQKAAEECMEKTYLLCDGVKKIPGASIVASPSMNMVGIKVAKVESVANELKKKGWGVAANPDMGCIRFVVMPHVSADSISRFLSDLKDIL